MKVKVGSECFPENKRLHYTSYSGRMVRILFLRDWDAICEERNEKILESEVIEEEVMYWNVLLSDQFGWGFRGATE